MLFRWFLIGCGAMIASVQDSSATEKRIKLRNHFKVHLLKQVSLHVDSPKKETDSIVLYWIINNIVPAVAQISSLDCSGESEWDVPADLR